MTALLTDNLPLLAGSPNGIKKLRELILELAVRGKLVPQDPNDEPASELLKRIAEEKARSIVDGTTKKQKQLSGITQDETPFEVPAGWCWVRMGAVGETNIGLTYSPSDVGHIGIPVLRSSNVQKGQIDLSDLVRVDISVKDSALVQEGDLLICARNGSKALVGKAARISNLTEPMAFGAFMAIFRSQLNPYLLRFISSPLFRKVIDDVNTTTINQITQNNLRTTLLPLPPLAEQHRIVAKVDELMALCDCLETRQTDADSAHTQLVQALLESLTQARDAGDFAQSWQRLAEHFHTLFTTESSIDALKQTLLQLAVMGKLVQQDPSDEPASELLKRIAEEKARLVVEGKIKKQKPLPEIGEEEKPLELPKEWGWSRLGDLLLEAYTGIDRGKSLQGMHLQYPYFKMNNILNQGGYSTSEMTRVDAASGDVEKYRLSVGDLLFNTRNSRELVGKTCVIQSLPEEIVLYNNNILRCKFLKGVLPELVDLWLRSITGGALLESIKSNTTNVCAIYQGNLFDVLCPVIPSGEQHRIVAKVDQLMALCDQLKARLNQARQVHEQLANALVEQAVA